MQTTKLLLTIPLCFICWSCASTPDLSQTSTFQTRISGSGLKHFQLSLQRPSGDKMSHSATPTRQARGDRAGKSGRSERRIQKHMLSYVDDLLLNNQFCREGYWVIDTSLMPQNTYLRGECNEPATPQDRNQFPDTLNYW